MILITAKVKVSLEIPKGPLTVSRSISLSGPADTVELTDLEFTAVQDLLASMRTKGYIDYTDPAGDPMIPDGTVAAGDLNAALQASISNLDAVMPVPPSNPYAGTGSYQRVGPDLNLVAAAGSNTPSAPKFVASIMGNIIGSSLTQVANYLAGTIGAYSVTGIKATRYPAAGVLGIIMDGVTDVDGAVVAEIDGDSSVTVANAAFKAMMKNSNAGSGFNYGLDLTSVGVDGYLDLAILKADLRLSKDRCDLSGAGAPTSGGSGTGAGFAGPCSRYADLTNKAIYLNVGTKASPTWNLLPSNYAESSPSLTFDHSVGALVVVTRMVGKMVQLEIPAAAIANGAGTVAASTALAAGLRPALAVTFAVVVIDNGTTRKAGQLVVGADGVLTFSVLGAGFTNAAAAGWDRCAVSYTVA